MPFERPSQGEKTVAWPLKKKIWFKSYKTFSRSYEFHCFKNEES